MEKLDINKKVFSLIKETCHVETEIELHKELGNYFNSITYIQFLIGCENEFNIEIDDDELDIAIFKTIEDIVNFINKKVNNN